MKTFNNLEDIIEFSVTYDDCNEFDCSNIELFCGDVTYKPYTVNISERELMFYSESGVLTYDVNNYGNGNVLELIEIEE